MSEANTNQTTFVTTLRSIGRVDVINPESIALSPIDTRLCHLREEPLVKFAAGSFSVSGCLFDLFDFQVFKHQHRILWSPLAQLGGGFPAECPVAVSLFSTQPFKHFADTVGVFVLCLMVGQLALQPLAGFTSSLISLLQSRAGNEQSLLISGSDQRIVNTKVDSDRYNGFWFGNFKRDTQSNSISPRNDDTIVTYCVNKISFRVIRNNIIKLLSSDGSRDRKLSLPSETEILGK